MYKVHYKKSFTIIKKSSLNYKQWKARFFVNNAVYSLVQNKCDIACEWVGTTQNPLSVSIDFVVFQKFFIFNDTKECGELHHSLGMSKIQCSSFIARSKRKLTINNLLEKIFNLFYN